MIALKSDAVHRLFPLIMRCLQSEKSSIYALSGSLLPVQAPLKLAPAVPSGDKASLAVHLAEGQPIRAVVGYIQDCLPALSLPLQGAKDVVLCLMLLPCDIPPAS